MRYMIRCISLFTFALSASVAVYLLWYFRVYYPRTEKELQAHFLQPQDLVEQDTTTPRVESGGTTSEDNKHDEGVCPIEVIPRVLHQTYKTADIPSRWRDAQNSCLELHRNNWTYMFWTDASAESLISTHYSWFLDTYRSYPYDIQRVDAIRYFLLYQYGGVYLDLDVGCKKVLDPLLRYDALLPKTKPMGVSNDVMASAPQHPFFGQVVRSLRSSSLLHGPKYAVVHFSTGPMFLTSQIILFWDTLARGAFGGEISHSDERGTRKRACQPAGRVRVIPPDMYGSGEHSFFAHYPGASWHGGDAELVKYLMRNKSLSLGFVLLLGGIALPLALYVINPRLVKRLTRLTLRGLCDPERRG